METDADQLARLNRMLERSHPSEWTREAFAGDVAAIRWAVTRFMELEGALKERDAGIIDALIRNTRIEGDLGETLSSKDKRIYYETIVRNAALAPAPAKEEEAQS